MKIKKYKCEFLLLSEIPLSEDGREELFNSDFTFGDANRCMYSLQRIFDEVGFTKEEDKDVILQILREQGDVLVDLEN